LGDASAVVTMPFQDKMIEGKPFGLAMGPVPDLLIEGADG
jgi:hypothetical protein